MSSNKTYIRKKFEGTFFVANFNDKFCCNFYVWYHLNTLLTDILQNTLRKTFFLVDIKILKKFINIVFSILY